VEVLHTASYRTQGGYNLLLAHVNTPWLHHCKISHGYFLRCSQSASKQHSRKNTTQQHRIIVPVLPHFPDQEKRTSWEKFVAVTYNF